MTSLKSQNGTIAQQPHVYSVDENVRTYAVMNNTSLSNNEVVQEQSIIYYNAPANYQQNQQPVLSPAYQTNVNNVASSVLSMTNSTIPSTLISEAMKRGCMDISGSSESHVQLQQQDYNNNQRICNINRQGKSCPQKDEATCRTCGTKCTNLADHQCSGDLKYVHCGGPHHSNDSKCKVVKEYRAALTRVSDRESSVYW
ncbi:unnamed protein product [Adineta ricciae]|uniref:Uncharacterized protein n=1 Tax=Adineta ricciae TaxID=249248 RepID=A0A815K880_ADIRI|nr:unnamed protein product [Adineta ricciae]